MRTNRKGYDSHDRTGRTLSGRSPHMKKMFAGIIILVCMAFVCLSALAAESFQIFRFYAGEQLYQLLITRDGEELTEPAAPPAPAGERFEGWYADKMFTTPFSFGPQTAANGTTPVYARFIRPFCFTYLDTEGNTLLQEEVIAGDSYTFDRNSPAYAVLAIDRINSGWRDRDGQVHDGDTITVTKNLTLKPVPADGYYARFFTQGGTFVNSQLLLPGEKVTRPDQDPVRTGYSFDGWYTETDGGTKFDFGSVPAGAVNIYARWIPDRDTPYKVVLWLENKDGGYDYGAAITKTGPTGGPVSFDPAADASAASRDRALYNVMQRDSTTSSRRYEMHVFENEKNAAEISGINGQGGIQGDGTTSLNVYARLKRFKVVLQDRNTGTAVKTYDGDEKWRADMYYDRSEIWNTYGYNTSVMFVNGTPLGGGSTSQNSQMRVAYPYHPDLYGRDIPDDAVVTFQLYTVAGDHYRRERYYQRLDDPDGNDRDRYELGFVLEFVASVGATGAVQNDETGFRVDHTMTTGWQTHNTTNDSYSFTPVPNILKFYMRRMKYTLSYDTGLQGNSLPEKEVLFEEPLAGYALDDTYIPDRTRMERAGITYVFKGWYDNPDLAGEPVTAATTRTMPAANLGLFAKWEPLAYTVHFDPAFGTDGGTCTGPAAVKVQAGEKISPPDTNPVRNRHGEWNWTFLGWTLAGKPYDFDSTVPEDNITLTAQWSRMPLPRVSFSAGEGSGQVPANRYFRTHSATIAPAGNGLDAPDGQHFIGWTQDGELYHPGEEIPIGEEDITLTAVFAEDGNSLYEVRYYRQAAAHEDVQQGQRKLQSRQETGVVYEEDPEMRKLLIGRIGTIAAAEPAGYEGYILKESLSTTRGVIAPDGSLVLRMYYGIAASAEDEPDPGQQETGKPVPQTGDSEDPVLYLALLLLGVAALSGTAPGRNIRREKD